MLLGGCVLKKVTSSTTAAQSGGSVGSGLALGVCIIRAMFSKSRGYESVTKIFIANIGWKYV